MGTKHRISDLPAGRLLDAAVSLALGWTWHQVPKDANGKHGGNMVLLPPGLLENGWQWPPAGRFTSPLRSWSSAEVLAGELIKRFRLSVQHMDGGGHFDGERIDAPHWLARAHGKGFNEMGLTLPVALSRAAAASVLGPEVEFAEEDL